MLRWSTLVNGPGKIFASILGELGSDILSSERRPRFPTCRQGPRSCALFLVLHEEIQIVKNISGFVLQVQILPFSPISSSFLDSSQFIPARPHPREACGGVSLPVAVYVASRCSRASHSRAFMLTGMLTLDRLAQSTASFGWQQMLRVLWISFFHIEMASCCQRAREDLCFHSWCWGQTY